MTILLIWAAQLVRDDLGRFDLAAERDHPSLSSRQECVSSSEGDTVVVCGRRKVFRLPLPIDRAASDLDARAVGEPSSPAQVLTPPGRCGIFAGERSCSRNEAARYGYGQGRDPLTVLLRLGTKLIDPDAEQTSVPRQPPK
jgi:hypothetical protein